MEQNEQENTFSPLSKGIRAVTMATYANCNVQMAALKE